MAYYTWSSPLKSHYKINVHVIHISRLFNGNMGIIIRDHNGRMIRGFTDTICGLSTVSTQLWLSILDLTTPVWTIVRSSP